MTAIRLFSEVVISVKITVFAEAFSVQHGAFVSTFTGVFLSSVLMIAISAHAVSVIGFFLVGTLVDYLTMFR